MSGGWGCPYETKGTCQKVAGRSCDPGMKGCVLFGRFLFSRPEKNTSAALRRKGPSPIAPGERREPDDPNE